MVGSLSKRFFVFVLLCFEKTEKKCAGKSQPLENSELPFPGSLKAGPPAEFLLILEVLSLISLAGFLHSSSSNVCKKKTQGELFLSNFHTAGFWVPSDMNDNSAFSLHSSGTVYFQLQVTTH